MDDLLNKINIFYNLFKEQYNFIFLFTYFIKEYINFNKLNITNDEIINIIK